MVIDSVDDIEEIFKVWASAARMRKWLMHKKQSLGQRFQTKDMEEESVKEEES